MNARNIPHEILIHLNEKGIYSPEVLNKYKGRVEFKIFISKSNSLNLEQQIRYDNLLRILEELEEKIHIETLERDEYQTFGVLGNIRNQIKGCSGLIIIGFEQFKIKNGDFRSSTEEHKELCDISLATPWNHIEAGMAAMLGLPILVLADKGINDGIFENTLDDSLLFHSSFTTALNTGKLRSSINEWLNAIKK
jgi:hypothetical protein